MTPAQFDALLKRKNQAEERTDWRSALIASVIANANRDSKKRPRPFTPADFMPQPGHQKGQSASQMLAIAEAWNELLGGQDKRKGAPE